MVRYGCYEEKRLIAFHLWATPQQHLRATSRLLHHRQVLLLQMVYTRQPQQLWIWRKQLIKSIFSLAVGIKIWFDPWARKKDRQCPPGYTSFSFSFQNCETLGPRSARLDSRNLKLWDIPRNRTNILVKHSEHDYERKFWAMGPLWAIAIQCQRITYIIQTITNTSVGYSCNSGCGKLCFFTSSGE